MLQLIRLMLSIGRINLEVSSSFYKFLISLVSSYFHSYFFFSFFLFFFSFLFFQRLLHFLRYPIYSELGGTEKWKFEIVQPFLAQQEFGYKNLVLLLRNILVRHEKVSLWNMSTMLFFFLQIISFLFFQFYVDQIICKS